MRLVDGVLDVRVDDAVGARVGLRWKMQGAPVWAHDVEAVERVETRRVDALDATYVCAISQTYVGIVRRHIFERLVNAGYEPLVGEDVGVTAVVFRHSATRRIVAVSKAPRWVVAQVLRKGVRHGHRHAREGV